MKNDSVRNSSLELMRIIAMLTVVAHHYVVNSGITELYDMQNITINMVVLQFWGLWGKTAINAFVMITGYFMCTSKLTVKKYFKMLFEVKFYGIILYIVFLVAGYEVFTLKRVFTVVFSTAYGMNRGFTSSFLMFYLFIPFLNILIKHLTKAKFRMLVGVLLAMFTLSSTFFFNSAIFHEIGWYTTLYFVSAYIRLYPFKWMEKNVVCGTMLFASIALSYLSVIVVDFFGTKVGFYKYDYMVSDSNKLLAFLVGVFCFLFFRNLKIKSNKAINLISSTTFGVLLIHANSDAMRTFLWKDILNVATMYTVDVGRLFSHAIISMLVVFAICSVIDILRIYFVEKPVMNYLASKKWFNKEL